MFARIFSRKWLFTTILVLAAVAVMVRLGFWQLDRLEQRRAFNSRVLGQIDQPPLQLDRGAQTVDLAGMEYRKVTVTGEYDFSQEIALRNQALNGRWGYHLITPLKIQGSDQIILIDRGWIPGDENSPVDWSTDWSAYAEPGEVTIQGVIRRSQSRPDFGRRSDPIPEPGQPRLETWNFVNVEGISRQVPYPLLPVYIQQAADPAWDGLPIRTQPELVITEGSHLGYAIQWFAFALILGAGYPFFIRRQESQQQGIETARIERDPPQGDLAKKRSLH